MPDAFSTRARRPSDPAISAFDITPDDASELPHVTLALVVTTPGDVYVTMADGTEAMLRLLPGQPFPVRVRRVWQTGTTATGISGLL